MKAKILIVFCLFCSILCSQIPDYEFMTEPVYIRLTFFDYMPGGNNGIPLQVENDGSVYLVFHATDIPYDTRLVYGAYLSSDGSVLWNDIIGSSEIHAGYPGIDIDLETSDPMIAFHGDFEPESADWEIVFSYDLLHLGNPGSWYYPFVIINDETQSANMPIDEFLWPELHIGPSPLPDKRRVYVIGKNGDDSFGAPIQNVLIGYADFDVNDLNAMSTLDWTYRTVDLLDQWHFAVPEYIRPYLSCSVSNDGKVALIGYSFSENSYKDSLIVFLNNNFGEGDFEYFSFPAYDVESPWPELQNLKFQPYYCDHQNSLFHDDNSKLSWLGNMLLMTETNWLPDSCFVYPKVFTFDIQTHELSFYDIYIEGEYPNDNIPMLPWDLNEDGIFDSTYANGFPKCLNGWPFYINDHYSLGLDNYYHLTKNEENGWLAAIWSDGIKARKEYLGITGYEQWHNTPEIAICISNNNGESWSQPILLNSLETLEFEDMIPEYVYPGDKIEDLENNHGKLHLIFLDDNEYGCQGGGITPTGGTITYCALDIDFDYMTNVDNNIISKSNINLTNFPNPFNPSTTISFNLSIEQNEPYELSIYNLKGQKVKQFSIFNSQCSIVWDGADQNNKPVSSGVYFAKLKAGNQVAVRKMLLIK